MKPENGFYDIGREESLVGIPPGPVSLKKKQPSLLLKLSFTRNSFLAFEEEHALEQAIDVKDNPTQRVRKMV